jgi:translation initiation factor IF-3
LIKQLRTNNQIRSPELQVIDENGKRLGVMSTADAMRLAKEQDLDLVEVGPNVSPPITKIMDYGKYIYRKERQEKKGPKPKEQERKTVRVGYKTGAHDLEFKAKQISEFLKEGHIVKIELTLRGREKALAHIGKEKLINFLKNITIEYSVQDNIKRSPYGWTIIVKKI